ncbi:glyoxalase [Mangrovactinospora gilvigrisea]|uniref:Glyoxalase n=1 Tax=Mangrovactinospora gilvigrisea TaxID=1428644 RepID=A0A1J7BQY6_9ACTN|nr:VOC family protein [Mangrovactinospora gilvigrisea]OIV35857.1 glyoxalase [Mangrovactinospora gilvigrisea]
MPELLDHIALQCADVAASAAFYDAVLAPLGAGRVLDFGEVIAFGRGHYALWIGPVGDADAGHEGRETHLAFTAPDRAAVRAFHAAALAMGAESLHAPALHPEYHPDYYGAFVRDPDGNNVEAVCHQPAPEPAAGPDAAG